MAGYRYPFDIQTTLEPLRHELGHSFDQVVATMADRDRSIEDFLRIIDPVARVQPWAAALTTPVPPGWLLCDGSAVSRVTYAALFASIGTTYGAGDGTNTFNLPNLATQGRVIATYDASLTQFNAIGLAGGTITASLAAHSHSGTSGNDSPDHSHGNTVTESVFHQHGNGVGTNTTAHGHGTTNDNQYASAPNAGGFFVSQNVGNQSVLHVHGTGGASVRHAHSIPAETGFGNNLPPYIVMRYLIRY